MVAAGFLFLTTPLINAAESKAQAAAGDSLCASLGALVHRSTREAAGSRNSDLLQTPTYVKLVSHTDNPRFRRVFEESFSLAQTIRAQGGRDDEAVNAVRKACDEL